MKRPARDLEPVPAGLRLAIRGDFAPVPSLASPWRRAGRLALPALAVPLAAHLAAALWEGVPSFSLSRLGCAGLQWLIGLALLWLAMREAVPGLGIGGGKAALALISALGLEAALGVLIWQRSGAGISTPDGASIGAQCALMETLIALPHLAVALWLARRAFPLRPLWAGALSGAGAGLLADVVWHLACPRTDLEHLALWHPGATFFMALLGAAAGWILSRGGRRPNHP